MGHDIPLFRDQERDVAGSDIDRAMDDAARSPNASDWYAALLADVAVCEGERRRFDDNCLVEHQDNSALPTRNPTL